MTDLIRRMGGEPPNTDSNTGIRYGCASLDDLADWVMDDIEAHGEDLTCKACETDRDEWGSCDMCEYPHDYRWETECEGPEGILGQRLTIETMELGGATLVMVTDSPWQTYTVECSPCVPCAGDLRPFSERPILGRAIVPTYDLPPEWWARRD
jgi:hypothetical protein